MRYLTPRNVKMAVALLIVGYLLDVPRLIIEIWNLPLPRLSGRPPYLFPFVLIATGIMMSKIAQRRSGQIVYPIDIAFGIAIAICLLTMALNAVPGQVPEVGVLVDIVLFYSGYFAVRVYRDYFGEVATLFRCLIASSALIVATHLTLLAAYFVSSSAFGAQPSQFLQRNGVANLAVFVCFYAWYLPNRLPRVVAAIVLPALALLHFWLDSSRGAFFVLAVLWGCRYVLRAHKLQWGAYVGLFGSIFGLIIVTFGLPLLSAHFPELLGAGNSRLSAIARLTTNYDLAKKLASSPFVGIGAAAVRDTRVLGYMSHSAPIIVLTSYGIIGAIAPAMVLVMMARGDESRKCMALNGIMLFILVTLFVNDLWPWLAVAVGAASLYGRAPGILTANTSMAAMLEKE